MTSATYASHDESEEVKASLKKYWRLNEEHVAQLSEHMRTEIAAAYDRGFDHGWNEAWGVRG